MVLNASFVCLPHSHFVEDHPIWILEDRPIISEVVRSHARKFHSIWVIVNRLTKSTHFIPVNTNYKVQKYAKIYIAHVLCLHGVLKMIISDRGLQFITHSLEQLHTSLRTHLIHSLAYHP
jgi:hypothetical protein